MAVQALVHAGTDVNHADVNGATALHHAAVGAGSDIPMVRVEAGVNPHAQDEFWRIPMHWWAVIPNKDPAVVRVLLDAGADLDIRDDDNEPALSPDECFHLGLLYFLGERVAGDRAEAAKWWRLAAARGSAKAGFKLGLMALSGTGVPQDYAEGLRWIRLAADLGHAPAQNQLRRMVAAGAGATGESGMGAGTW